MTEQANIEQESEESRIQRSDPINWEKIGVRIGVIVSFLTIVGFLISMAVFMWTFHADVVNLAREQGRLEGKISNVTPVPTANPSTQPAIKPNPKQ